MKTTLVDLFVFGNRNEPRAPRVIRDLVPDNLGNLQPEVPPNVQGASLVADPAKSMLRGHYFLLAAGTELPDGVEVCADGRDVDPDSIHGESHHTIFPTELMAASRFIELFKELPWKYAGKK